MGRRERIRSLLEEMLPELIRQRCEAISADQGAHSGELVNELLEALQAVAGQAKRLQETGEKGAIEYLVFSYLSSGLLLGTHCIRVDLLDERLYCDPEQAAAYLDFTALYHFLEPDLEQITANIKQHLPHIWPYETDQIRLEYGRYYHKIAGQFLREMLEEPDLFALFDGIALSETVTVLFGGYLDEADQLLVFRRDDHALL